MAVSVITKVPPYKVYVLEEGYSRKVSELASEANCTCTLVKGPKNIIVDTMTPWDTDKIISGLKRHDLTCADISFLVCTHGHSDHIGNNNLFLNALHIVGFDINHKNKYLSHPFKDGTAYEIDEFVKVLPTPGHTLGHVSVLVHTVDQGAVAVAGDLFESEEDLLDSSLWYNAGSENRDLQKLNREKIMALADWIIPGHGPMFKVTPP